LKHISPPLVPASPTVKVLDKDAVYTSILDKPTIQKKENLAFDQRSRKERGERLTKTKTPTEDEHGNMA
jgi:hypothetical protein